MINQLRAFSSLDINFKFFKYFFNKEKLNANEAIKNGVIIKKGEKIIVSEVPGQELIFVKKGKIEIFTSTHPGQKNIVGIINSGSILEKVTSGGLTICSVAITLMDSELVYVTKEMLSEILKVS